MRKRPCIQYVPIYLPITAVWIYNLLNQFKNHTPYVLTRKIKNPHLFPVKYLESLSELSLPARYLHIFMSKVSGVIPLFYEYSKQTEPAVFHIHFGNIAHKLIPLVRKLNVPSVCSFYGSDAYLYPRSGAHRKNLIKLFNGIDLVLVLGPAMKEELMNLGCPENKIRIQHLGIEVDKIRFQKRQLTKNRKLRFLIASSFVEKKGLDITIRALGKVNGKFDFTVDLIGDGPLKTEIFDLIKHEKLSDIFQIHGYKPYDFLIEKAFECDVFLQASRTAGNFDKEGTPMVFADVMATGMPVISTRHSDIPELIKHDVTGYLAVENDPDSYTQCIVDLFENVERLEELSINSRKHIEKEFDIQKQADTLESYYHQLTEFRK